MRSYSVLITTLLPLLVTASPNPEAKAEAEPAPQFNPFNPASWASPAPAGSLPASAPTNPLTSFVNGILGGGAAQACKCTLVPRCIGTTCECGNADKVACWVQQRGACKIDIQACPASATNKNSGLPVPIGSTYPPCGRGLPNCNGGNSCKKLDAKCGSALNSGDCLGVCVPQFEQPKANGGNPFNPFLPQPAKGSPAKDSKSGGGNPFNPFSSQPAKGKSNGGTPFNPFAPQPPKATAQPQPQPPPQPQQPIPPAPGLCPASFNCGQSMVCISDPRASGQVFTCVTPNEICGGFRNDACKDDKLCVRDPRLQCEGSGCTGICV